MVKKFILASSSKSRLRLLEAIGFKPLLTISPDVDESPKKREKPIAISVRLAAIKAQKAFEMLDQENKQNAVILGADTVTYVGTRLVDKALTREDILSCAKALSDRNHIAATSLCFLVTNENGEVVQKIEKTAKTRVKVKHLTPKDIQLWADSGEGIGNSGGIATDGIFGSFVIGMSGSHQSSIKGLPFYETRNVLSSLGVK